MAPACATKASAGMVVASENERIDRHRKTLLALYVTDHDAETKPGQAPNELLAMVQQYAAPENWGVLENKREARAHDVNPYIHFDPTMCIACARCTRYCDEVEQVTAITLADRGSETTISTVDRLGLLDTTCEMCGGCVDTCPTGAMREKLLFVCE